MYNYKIYEYLNNAKIIHMSTYWYYTCNVLIYFIRNLDYKLHWTAIEINFSGLTSQRKEVLVPLSHKKKVLQSISKSINISFIG
jgi:hypothetical protein